VPTPFARHLSDLEWASKHPYCTHCRRLARTDVLPSQLLHSLVLVRQAHRRANATVGQSGGGPSLHMCLRLKT
jgi:hypothetical protein